MDLAVIWYRKAAANGNRGAQHNLGYFYYCGIEVQQDLRRAFEYFMLAARQGKPDSMRNLGVMYELGQYVNRDMEEAMRWYKLAAENGDSNAYEDYIRLDNMIDFLDH